jgi:hypothetical protein
MITGWFMSMLTGLVTGISYVIPNVDFSGIVTDAGSVYGYLMGYLIFLNPVVNIPVLFALVQGLIDLLLAGLAFRFFNWVFNHIPFIGAFG